MSDEAIKKFVVTLIALISFAVWMMLGHGEPNCSVRCVTDISAQHR
jgi:hypothetical protein